MQYQIQILKYKDSDTMPPWNNSITIIYNQYKEWTIISMLLLLEKKSKQTLIIIIIIIIIIKIKIKMNRIIWIEERRWGINRHRIGDYPLLLLLVVVVYKPIVSIFLNDVFLQFILIVSQLFCIINRINRKISFL